MTDVAPRLIDDTPPMEPDALLTFLADLGIGVTTVEHLPVYTVEEAKGVRGRIPGAHTKNLFVRDKKGVMWLIVALENQSVDLRGVAGLLGHKRFSFGSPQRLMHYLGLTPGSVTPFGVVNDRGGHVSVALDEGLRRYDVWNFHPLVNSMTTSVASADMLRFLEATGHAPRWVSLD